MKDQLYKKIIENYIEAYNTFDIERMLQDMHENVRFENISDGEVNMVTNGIDELRNQAKKAIQLFRKREQKVLDMKFDDDRAEIHIDYKGILAVDLPDGLKAGDKIELKGKSVFTFRDNKIIELKDLS